MLQRRASAVMGDQVGPRTPSSDKHTPANASRMTDYDTMSNDEFFSSHENQYDRRGSHSHDGIRHVSPVMRHSASMPLGAGHNGQQVGLLRSVSMGQSPMNYLPGYDGRSDAVLEPSRAQDIDEELFIAFSANCSNKVRINFNMEIKFKILSLTLGASFYLLVLRFMSAWI
jgi:hypothetical protein